MWNCERTKDNVKERVSLAKRSRKRFPLSSSSFFSRAPCFFFFTFALAFIFPRRRRYPAMSAISFPHEVTQPHPPARGSNPTENYFLTGFLFRPVAFSFPLLFFHPLFTYVCVGVGFPSWGKVAASPKDFRDEVGKPAVVLSELSTLSGRVKVDIMFKEFSAAFHAFPTQTKTHFQYKNI